MNNHLHIDEIKRALDTTKSVFVLLPQNPSLDATAGALALFLSLKESGKNVFIGSPTPMRVEYKNLVGVDRIAEKIGNRNLIISFDYKEDAIEKVSYNVEEGNFNLVIEPKAGNPPLSSKGVKFSYEGIEAQLIFVIGAKRLEDLTELYEKDRQAFTAASVVNIDNKAGNTNFGQINVVNQGTAAISESVFEMLKRLSLPMNVDIAGNLMKGIEAQTQNLQAPFAGPDTFDAVAQLMRAGAKRAPIPPVAPTRQWMGRPPFPTMTPQPPQQRNVPTFKAPPPPAPTTLEEPKLEMDELSNQAIEPTDQTQSPQQRRIEPKRQSDAGQARAQQTQERGNDANQIQTGQSNDAAVREDWLKPKIYKSSSDSE